MLRQVELMNASLNRLLYGPSIPMSRLLDSIDSPDDIRTLTISQLRRLAEEIRELIIEVVAANGGHLSSNLGVVELTLALHYCHDFLRDRLVWDVSHQAYTHKIITGRRDEFRTLRQKGGISGFTRREESPYDLFTFGHTGTSVSAGLGLASAMETAGEKGRVVAVIGDGAIASGMPFEALNHAAETEQDLLVVLNDNKMSISPSVGGVARYLSKIRASGPYVGIKREVKDIVGHWQKALEGLDKIYGRLSEGVQTALTPGGLFVELGFDYYGPVDGHDLDELVDTFQHMKRLDGPILLHVLTQKGYGFEPAREDPTGFHSSGTFELKDGEVVCSAVKGTEDEGEALEPDGDERSWSEAMGDALVKLAGEDERIVAITAAMCGGTGLDGFARLYPERFYDVGICEQHGVGFAGGLATGGMRPVACIYSTFLQRARDQIFHDVALQTVPVLFGVDRAGLVGNDGPTHHGLNDIAAFRGLPGFVVMAPADAPELEQMVRLALDGEHPAAIRYPRETVSREPLADSREFEIGQAGILREGPDGAIIAYGALVQRAMQAADDLAEGGLEITVVNARFAKPLDLDTITTVVSHHPAVILAEDHVAPGGFGAAVLEALAQEGVPADHVRLATVPDRFIEQAPRDQQLADLRLDGAGLAARMREMRD
jgi:1-deoxy-D-xylulose-5-phosphate synthase